MQWSKGCIGAAGVVEKCSDMAPSCYNQTVIGQMGLGVVIQTLVCHSWVCELTYNIHFLLFFINNILLCWITDTTQNCFFFFPAFFNPVCQSKIYHILWHSHAKSDR